jgi:hypothetical protein
VAVCCECCDESYGSGATELVKLVSILNINCGNLLFMN